MRLLSVIACLLVSFGSLVAQNGKPSLQETLDWINEKVTVSGNFSPSKGSLVQTVFGFEAKKFEGCEITFIERVNVSGAGIRESPGSLVTIILGDIDAASIRVSKGIEDPKPNSAWRDWWAVVLPTAKGKPKIKYQTLNRFGRGETVHLIDSMPIRIDDEALGPRLVEAFSHAVRLCTSERKPEPF